MTTALPFIDELRRIPADRLGEVADFINTLVEERRVRQERMVDETSGSLAGGEGEALEAPWPNTVKPMKTPGSVALDSSVIVRHMRTVDYDCRPAQGGPVASSPAHRVR